MPRGFDVLVAGGGHAGVEAALAAARLGVACALITLDPARVAALSCNPAVGGLGKGHLVKEIDALGGLMAWAADQAAIQYRRLNTRKGPAVRASRLQVDRDLYPRAVRRFLAGHPNLTVLAGEVVEVLLDRGRVAGFRLADGTDIPARAGVLTTGTFLSGLIHVGGVRFPAGRLGEAPAAGLSASLRRLGLELGRLKTGTPPRVFKDSIDFGRLQVQPPDPRPQPLSVLSGPPRLPQLPCHLTRTTERTREIILEALPRSPLYGGAIQGRGARYCPSIEDKYVKFPDKYTHHVFIEPEGLRSPEVYPNGVSTSLPLDVQELVVRSLPGLENARLARPGYAIEYDYVNPRQLGRDLMLPTAPGLFLAGQINGTSGYEEAAAQGLLAGLNAARHVRDLEPVVLGREQAYLGVMVDDLTTLGAEEPYRMFTSRAEYRLVLREDNAAERLTPLGRQLGLVDDRRWRLFLRRREGTERARDFLSRARLRPSPEADAWLAARGGTPLREPVRLADLLRRPEITWPELAGFLAGREGVDGVDDDAAAALEVEIKYAGYARKQADQAVRLKEMEDRPLRAGLDFAALAGLSRELREKLGSHRPRTLGQAARVPGITPAALAILAAHTVAAGHEAG